MTVLFGWNTYCLKSVSATELGLDLNQSQNFSIQYRQRYFHLFFIPIIPIGRFWAIKQFGQLYNPNQELRQRLEAHRSAGKHGVWAWTGPLLGLIIFLFVSVNEKLELKRNKEKNENSKALLNAFFHDESKTRPLLHKLTLMDVMIDSAIVGVKYDHKDLDTSMAALLPIYLEAKLSRADSLTGYNEINTLVITNFSNEVKREEIINDDYKKSLIAGEWKGYYGDTSSAYTELRKLEQYKYVLVVSEYNRIEPVTVGESFNSGYLLAKGNLLSAETGKTIKSFKIMTGNSDQVTQYSYGNNSYSSNSTGLKSALKSDLERNARKEALEYVFGKE